MQDSSLHKVVERVKRRVSVLNRGNVGKLVLDNKGLKLRIGGLERTVKENSRRTLAKEGEEKGIKEENGGMSDDRVAERVE